MPIDALHLTIQDRENSNNPIYGRCQFLWCHFTTRLYSSQLSDIPDPGTRKRFAKSEFASWRELVSAHPWQGNPSRIKVPYPPIPTWTSHFMDQLHTCTNICLASSSCLLPFFFLSSLGHYKYLYFHINFAIVFFLFQ